MPDPDVPTETDPEAPEADLAEQHTSVSPDDDESDELPAELPPDADPADVSEQAREVGYDDDYR
jgi:hypothetical protein